MGDRSSHFGVEERRGTVELGDDETGTDLHSIHSGPTMPVERSRCPVRYQGEGGTSPGQREQLPHC